jgi:hypothetical protein
MGWDEHEGRPLSELEHRAYEAGRSPEDQRAYERGRANAEARMNNLTWQPQTAVPEPEVRQLVSPPQVHGTGPRAMWGRHTWGGWVAGLFPAPDEAGELVAAKAEADRHEFTYGSRPDLQQCLHKVRGSGTGTSTVVGSPATPTADVLAMLRLVAPDHPVAMVVGPDPASAQVGGIVTAPGGRFEAHGDPAIAAATLEQLARRQ